MSQNTYKDYLGCYVKITNKHLCNDLPENSCKKIGKCLWYGYIGLVTQENEKECSVTLNEPDEDGYTKCELKKKHLKKVTKKEYEKFNKLMKLTGKR